MIRQYNETSCDKDTVLSKRRGYGDGGDAEDDIEMSRDAVLNGNGSGGGMGQGSTYDNFGNGTGIGFGWRGGNGMGGGTILGNGSSSTNNTTKRWNT